MAAIGQAARKGVLIKSGEALEKMGRVDCVAFDKTGTLTSGRLEVSDVIPAPGISAGELLTVTAAAESRSEHPIGQAIAASAARRGITPPDPADFRMTPGKGVAARIDGHQVLCGSAAFLAEHRVTLSDNLNRTLEKLRSEGKAPVLVSRDARGIGIVALSDQVRPAAAAVVSRLKALGASVVLLTGDHAQTARCAAAAAGIEELRAELLPEEKVDAIRTLEQQNRCVAMVGDGVNDAPALKTATVGIAMGGMGSDITVEAADIALMSDDIERIPYLKRLSNATIATIKFNITLSMLINLAAITLSVQGLLTPVTGALVHNAGSVLVVLNAALLYDRKFR